jgi:thiol-disulfide isomerase/thioredoxin
MTVTKISLLLILGFSLLSIFSPVHGQDITREYVITGTVKGIDSGTVRMLSSDENKPMDSALIVDGTFSMKGKIVMPERLLFNISPGNWNFRAFVEDANIKLLVDTTGAQSQGRGTDKWALIWEIKETGSAFADIYEEYNKETKQQYYVAIISSLREKNKEVGVDTVASAKINLAMDSVRKLLLAKQKVWIEDYIDQNPVSIAGVYIFNEYFQNYRYFQPSTQTTLSYLDFTLNRFAGIAATSRYYKELAEIAHNLRNVQQETFAPDFTLLQRDNSRFTLSSTRGKYSLIDFWASWCLPCRKAIPFWKQLYFKYKDKGFVIVGVSGDRKLNDWTKALDQEKMSWVQVIDKFPDDSKPAIVSESFGIYSLPYYVLLDKAGKVIISSNDKNIVKEKIEEIFHR